MKRSALIVAIVLVVSVGAWAAYHFTGAKFQGSVALTDVSEAGCMALLTTPGNGYPDPSLVCAQGNSGVWFRASVKNVGFRGAYLTGCVVEGLDSAGKVVFRGTLPVRPNHTGSGGYYLDGRQTYTWLWFISHAETVHPFSSIPGLALSYRATCAPIDYGGHIPT